MSLTDTPLSRFRSYDGVEIAYREWGQGAVPVLLHHGFAAEHNLNWIASGVVGALLDHGRRVVALDARGHGESDKPHDPAAYGEGAMGRDVVGLVDHLKCARYDLVGYSMGAIVALFVAIEDAARVRRLAVGGVGAGVVELGGLDTRAVGNLAIAGALEIEDPSQIKDVGAAGFRAFADMTGADRKALAAVARAVNTRKLSLGRIDAKTLVFAASDDFLAARPEVLSAAIPGATLLRLQGDHLTALADPRFKPALVEHMGS